MYVGIVELVLNLLPCVVVDIGTLQRWMPVIERLEFYRFHIARGQLELLHAAAGEYEQVFAFPVGDESAADFRAEYRSLVVAQVAHIQFVASFRCCGQIVEFVAFGRQIIIDKF